MVWGQTCNYSTYNIPIITTSALHLRKLEFDVHNLLLNQDVKSLCSNTYKNTKVNSTSW